MQYYPSREYHAAFDNWSILQDRRGVMYFGNGSGLLEFDGVSWRLIKTPNNSAVRCLDMDASGRIYVAAISDFGYLEPDSAGLLSFISLKKHLQENIRALSDVWSVRTSSHGVYFKTADRIFRWQDGEIKVWDLVNSYRLYEIDDEIYVRNRGIGLMKILGDSLVLVPDGAKFSNIGIFNMLPFPEFASDKRRRILITTNFSGLFLYDGITFEKYDTEADYYLIRNQIYNAAMLPDSSFAFATQRGGVVVIDRNGQLVQIIDESAGLQSQVVYDVYPDLQGGLWLAMNDGLARVDIPSPFSLFDNKVGIRTAISSAVRFGKRLYVTDAFGVCYLEKATEPGNSARFTRVSAVDKPGSHLMVSDGSLYVASNGGIFLIGNSGNIQKLISWPSDFLYHSQFTSDRIYVGTMDGLFFLQKKQDRWVPGNQITDLKDNISEIVETGSGDLWLRCRNQGVIRLKLVTDSISGSLNLDFQPERFDSGVEIPFQVNHIFSFDGKTLFATTQGLKRFDVAKNRFIADSSFGARFADSAQIVNYLVRESPGKWIFLTDSAGINSIGTAELQKDGHYRWHEDSRLNRLDIENIFRIFTEGRTKTSKNIWWISTADGLVRYNPDIEFKKKIMLPALIRQVTVGGDSIVYFGTVQATGSLPGKNGSPLPYADNNILFEFTLPEFDLPRANQYQYNLEGNDNSWSDWTSAHFKEYTNLAGGDYRFRVRAKNVYGQVSGEAWYEFTVLPPWYRTWLAYSLFAGILLFVLYFIRGYELKRIGKKQKRELELVEYQKLKELDQLKTRFFANISHEFRTPLTLILGQVDSVMGSKIGIPAKSKLQVAYRNSRRLLDLINQLLDLSKLESGSLELKAESRNIVSFAKSLFYSFESLAERKNISLNFQCNRDSIPVLFDPDKMEKIFYNLFSNALKFTPPNGSIQVEVFMKTNGETEMGRWAIEETLSGSPDSKKEKYVQIKIRDSGIGIPARQLPHVFDRFYQADSSQTREFEGTGIGLALTKELVELHKGRITVSSVENSGTEFIIYLPLSDSKLEQNDEFQSHLASPKQPITAAGGGELIKIRPNEKQKLVNRKNEIVLVVEDNPDVRAYIREQLEKDYCVIEAANGKAGIEQAQNSIPDLIVTDVMMPQMDGYEFSRFIRADEKTSHIPIIMLTAKAALDDKIEGLETGADAYLTKPFSSKELQVRVRNLVLQRRQLRQRFSKATVIKPAEVTAISMDQAFLEKVIASVESNLSEESYSVDQLAGEAGMSVSQLNRKLGALIDQPAGKLIRSMRLQRAADLLKQNAGTVAEICYQVGFGDQANFSRAFKKQFGVAPGEYRKN